MIVIRQKEYGVAQKAIGAARKIGQAIKKGANEAYYNTGGVVDKGVKLAVENPILATSQVASVAVPGAGIVTGSAPLLAAGMATPWTLVGGVGEGALSKLGKGYKATTKRWGEKYANSNASKKIKAWPSINDGVQRVKKILTTTSPTMTPTGTVPQPLLTFTR